MVRGAGDQHGGRQVSDTAVDVAAVLADLCRDAGVSGDNGTAEAGAAVCNALVAAGVRIWRGDATDPETCAIGTYLRERCRLKVQGEVGDGCGYLVTSERVLLTHRAWGQPVVRESVPLPAAIRAAVKLVAKRAIPALYTDVRRAA